MSIIRHLERHLGPIDAGWNDQQSKQQPFQIVSFSNGPLSGTTVFSTLGLNKVPLRYSPSGSTVRQELILICYTKDVNGRLPAVLDQISQEHARRKEAVRLREVIGPRGTVFPGSTVVAFYVATPVYLPDSFGIYHPLYGNRVLIGWLVPITAPEAAFIHRHGPNQFEEMLETLDPDLLDFRRPSMV